MQRVRDEGANNFSPHPLNGLRPGDGFCFFFLMKPPEGQDLPPWSLGSPRVPYDQLLRNIEWVKPSLLELHHLSWPALVTSGHIATKCGLL